MTDATTSTHGSLAIGAATLLLAVGFAGCIGAMAEPSTGQTHEDTAEQRAAAWDEEATLVSVTGAEAGAPEGYGWSQRSQASDTSHGDVGDGQAPAWEYTYENGTGALEVVVAANGTVLAVDETEHRNRTPIGDWTVASTEAVEIAADHSDAWTDVDPRHAWYALGHGGEHRHEDPVWILGVTGEERGPVVAMVNATTGEFVGAWDTDYTWGGFGSGWGSSWGNASGEHGSWNTSSQPPEEGGSFEDTLTAAEPEHEHTFRIDHDGHDVLQVELALDRSVWHAVRADVTGPDGESITLEADSAEPTDRAHLAQPSPGTYTVTVAFEQGPMVLEDGIAQEYELAWCAHGESWGTGFDDDGC